MTKASYNIIQFNEDSPTRTSPPPLPEALSSDDDNFSIETQSPPRIINTARKASEFLDEEKNNLYMEDDKRSSMMAAPYDLSFEIDYSDLDYSSEDESVGEALIDEQIISLPTTKTRSLIIDEIDMSKRKPTFATSMVSAASSSPNSSPEHGKSTIEEPYVICSHVQKSNRLTLEHTNTIGSQEKTEFPSMTDLLDAIWPTSPIKSAMPKATSQDELTLTKTKSGTFDYQVKHSILEGWLSKKGTGNDFFGSKSWKVRWCNLVLGSIPGHMEDEIPMLLVSWHPSMPASTIFILHSRVAIGVDRKKDDSKDCEELFCFDIVAPYAKSRMKESNRGVRSQSRSFSASQTERNKWVKRINQTIKEYERKISKARRQSSVLPPTAPTRSNAVAQVRLNGLNLLN